MTAESDLAAKRLKLVTDTLDALVEEAYAAAQARGDTIKHVDSWRSAVRKNFAAEARERGAGFLAKHHSRLLGSGRVMNTPKCSFCEAALYGAWLEMGEDKYCNLDCANHVDKRMTYAEWKAKVEKDGGYRSESGEWVPVEQLTLFRATKKPPAASA